MGGRGGNIETKQNKIVEKCNVAAPNQWTNQSESMAFGIDSHQSNGKREVAPSCVLPPTAASVATVARPLPPAPALQIRRILITFN